MGHPYWPLFDLRIRTTRLEIRVPSDEDLIELASLAARGVHDPATMPFLKPWTDEPSPSLERGVLQWGWRHRAGWEPDNWTLTGAVVVEGNIVGVQDLMANDFAAQRVVKSGSWLGLEHQGQGIGKEMRAAILYFAFVGLNARTAKTGGFSDNLSSLGVTRALGYRESGRHEARQRESSAEIIDFTLERSEWESTEHPAVTITGLAECVDLFIRPGDG